MTLTLKRYGFSKKFIKWIKTLQNNQEACIRNGGITTKYFKLNKYARQGDPKSAYLFILVLEIMFNLIKLNKDIHGLIIFGHTFLHTVYADDTAYFLKDKKPLK